MTPPDAGSDGVLALRFEDSPVYIHYVDRLPCGYLIRTTNGTNPTTDGIRESVFEKKVNDPGTETWIVDREDTPFAPSEFPTFDEVFKFTFAVSHAPVYVMQHDNGDWIGTFAIVEWEIRDEPGVWKESIDSIVHWIGADHVQVNRLPVDRSPYRPRD